MRTLSPRIQAVLLAILRAIASGNSRSVSSVGLRALRIYSRNRRGVEKSAVWLSVFLPPGGQALAVMNEIGTKVEAGTKSPV